MVRALEEGVSSGAHEQRLKIPPNSVEAEQSLIGGLMLNKAAWDKVVAGNGGSHPNCGDADTRLLNRMRHSAVPATQGAGMHPDRQFWINEPRDAQPSGFVPKNKFREGREKAF